eukprot:scaffold11445_cov113-Skeletonema_dohrnii-CCMP3373.AAC.3
MEKLERFWREKTGAVGGGGGHHNVMGIGMGWQLLININNVNSIMDDDDMRDKDKAVLVPLIGVKVRAPIIDSLY